MTAANDVTYVGVDDARRDLERWAEQLGPKVLDAADPFAERVGDVVRARLPHLTGQLAGSVDTGRDDDAVTIGLGDDVDYAGWIEFGGSRGRPYIDEGRYLAPTVAEFVDEFATLAADTADDTVRRFAWSTPASA